MPRFLVLPSPFLPAVAYDPLVAALQDAGHPAHLADGSEPVSGPHLVERWARAAVAAEAEVLLAHSNAGLCAPGVRAAAAAGAPLVLLDAALPPAEGSTRMAAPAFREHLTSLVDEDGSLPPWTRWWLRRDDDELVPDATWEHLDAACPRVPLAYVDSEISAPPGWAAGPDAFLAFGTTYASETAFATVHGWPTRVMEAGHLHLVNDPDDVVTAVLELLARLRQDVRRSPPDAARLTQPA